MTGILALICGTAIFFNLIIPAASQMARQISRAKLFRELQGGNGIFASCTSFLDSALTVTPVGTEKERSGPFSINPSSTRFFMLEKDGNFERLRWKSVFLIRNGITLSYFPGKRRRNRGICLFHEETEKSALEAHLARLAGKNGRKQKIRDPLQYFSVAFGSFAEFCLFLATVTVPELRSASIAALVAIFAKALPYCPPGLFLTLAAQIPVNPAHGAKKSRQRAAVGFVLVTAGIVLNIAVIFFVIRRIGIGFP